MATLLPHLTSVVRERRLFLTQRLLLGFEVRCFGFHLICLITGGEECSLTASHKLGHSGPIIEIRFGKNPAGIVWLTNLGSIWGNDQSTRGTTDGW